MSSGKQTTHDAPGLSGLPPAIQEAIGVANREDGSPEQVARLEARLSAVLGGSALASAAQLAAVQSGGAPTSSGAASVGVSAASVGPSAAVTASTASGWLGAHAATIKLVAAAVLVAGGGAVGGLRLHSHFAPTEPRTGALHAPLARPENVHQPSLRSGEPVARHGTTEPVSGASNSSSRDVVRETHAERAAELADRPRAPGDRLRQEASLLNRARARLSDDPSAALRLTDQHRAQHRHGGLVEEREALAIQALLRVGRRMEAKQRFSQFRSSFPDSPQIRKLAAQVASEGGT